MRVLLLLFFFAVVVDGFAAPCKIDSNTGQCLGDPCYRVEQQSRFDMNTNLTRIVNVVVYTCNPIYDYIWLGVASLLCIIAFFALTGPCIFYIIYGLSFCWIWELLYRCYDENRRREQARLSVEQYLPEIPMTGSNNDRIMHNSITISIEQNVTPGKI